MRTGTRKEVIRRLAGRTLRELVEELGLPDGDRAVLSDIATGKHEKVSKAKENLVRQALGLRSLYPTRYRVEVGEAGYHILMGFDTPMERDKFLEWALDVWKRWEVL